MEYSGNNKNIEYGGESGHSGMETGKAISDFECHAKGFEIHPESYGVTWKTFRVVG